MELNTLSLAHKFITEHVRPGDTCIDATAGRGRDTALLCRLAGPGGRVLAFDIQPDAVRQTRELLDARGLGGTAQVILDSHVNMEAYAAPGSVDCIVFNLGWLPGGDHGVHTVPETSIPAIEAALRLIRPGGVISLCIYYGGSSGYYAERDAILAHLAALDPRRFTVIVSTFHNRTGDPPIPVEIYREL